MQSIAGVALLAALLAGTRAQPAPSHSWDFRSCTIGASVMDQFTSLGAMPGTYYHQKNR
jgi:hypothetical protein